MYPTVDPMEGSPLGSEPRVFPYKLPTGPPCGNVLTAGMHDAFSTIPAFK